MKWVFALLLLLNAGVWMWGTWYKNLAADDIKRPRTPINPEQMRLLSEPGVNPRPRPPEAPNVEPLTPVDANTATDKEEPKSCYSFGPFSSQAVALDVGNKLGDLKFTFILRNESVRMDAGYRVFLAPFASTKQAQARRAQLIKRGITDSALIPDSETHALSLGIFSQEGNARAYIAQLTKKGIKAQSETLYSMQTQYWLDLQPQNPPLHPTLDNLTRLKGAADAHLSEVSCPVPAAGVGQQGAPTPNTRPGTQ